MLTRIKVCVLLALTYSPSLFGADLAMKVTDKNYLDTQGFSVFLYDSTYHPVFVDQKNTAMEMILRSGWSIYVHGSCSAGVSQSESSVALRPWPTRDENC